MNVNPNDPAFPSAVSYNEYGQLQEFQISETSGHNKGITIRTEISSRAMAALISNDWSVSMRDKVADLAVQFTDALIARLNQPIGHPNADDLKDIKFGQEK